MLYFFVKETAIIKNGVEAIFNNIADEYHGQVLTDFQQVIDFIESFITRLTLFRDASYDPQSAILPKIHYAPTMISERDWIDITIWVEGIITCKIIKAKKEVKNGLEN